MSVDSGYRPSPSEAQIPPLGEYSEQDGRPVFKGFIGMRGDAFYLHDEPAQVARYVFDPLYVAGGEISEAGVAYLLDKSEAEIGATIESLKPHAKLLGLAITEAPERTAGPHTPYGKFYSIQRLDAKGSEGLRSRQATTVVDFRRPTSARRRPR